MWKSSHRTHSASVRKGRGGPWLSELGLFIELEFQMICSPDMVGWDPQIWSWTERPTNGKTWFHTVRTFTDWARGWAFCPPSLHHCSWAIWNSLEVFAANSFVSCSMSIRRTYIHARVMLTAVQLNLCSITTKTAPPKMHHISRIKDKGRPLHQH